MASKLRNQTSPFSSRTVNPGAAPADFGRMTVQRPGAGPSIVLGPRVSSATEIGLAYTRFVNQLESGTSSIEFRFCARTFGVGIAGPREEVRQEIGGQIDIPFLDLRRVLRVWLTRDRIVVVEPWRRASCGKWDSCETGGKDDESERQFAHVRMGHLRRTRTSSLPCL